MTRRHRHPSHPRRPSRSALLRPSRRELFAAGGLGLAGLGLPRLAGAAGSERKFLFVYNIGGWDTSLVFTPLFGTEADVEPDATEAEASGVPFVDHPDRPEVRAFFEDFGDRTCVVNGLEVQSVTHERCRQLLLTGRSDAGADDWPAQLAAASEAELVLPHLVLSGPTFTSQHTSRVVRVGGKGQLTKLLDGSALSELSVPVELPPGGSAVDRYLRDRVDRFSTATQSPQAASFGQGYGRALEDLDALRELSGVLDLTPQSADCTRDLQADFATAFDCFELGISRCAMVQYNGWCDQTWDTHQRPELQVLNFEELFGHLHTMMRELEDRPGETSASLADEVTVVVCSEMGRHPRSNAWGGKDHWTYTSLMLLGSGVQGGQALGAFDEGARGRTVDLQTGELDGGTALLPEHLGETLLALAGEAVDEGRVLRAALR